MTHSPMNGGRRCVCWARGGRAGLWRLVRWVLNLGPWIFVAPLAACAAVALVPAFAEKRSPHSPPAAVCYPGRVLCSPRSSSRSSSVRQMGHGVWAVHEGHRDVIWGLAFAACAGNILGGFVADLGGSRPACWPVALRAALEHLRRQRQRGDRGHAALSDDDAGDAEAVAAIRRSRPGLRPGRVCGAGRGCAVYVFPIEWITPRPLLSLPDAGCRCRHSGRPSAHRAKQQRGA